MPTKIDGYVRQGESVRGQLRLTQYAGIIEEFPAMDHGCEQGLYTVRWRSLSGDPIEVGSTIGDLDPVLLSEVRDITDQMQEPATSGLWKGKACEEPVFFAYPDQIRTIAWEYQAWVPAALKSSGNWPAMPSSLPGFEREGLIGTGTSPTSPDGAVIVDFPAAMNGCDTGAYTVRWRSLSGTPVQVGRTAGGLMDSEISRVAELTDDVGAARTSGLWQGANCEQPVFFSDNSATVRWEYQYWVASV